MSISNKVLAMIKWNNKNTKMKAEIGKKNKQKNRGTDGDFNPNMVTIKYKKSKVLIKRQYYWI
jgi:hypothetical protein